MGTTNAGQNYESSNVNSGVAEAAVEAYRLVKQGTAENQVTPCTAITDIAIGVSLNKAAIGEPVSYQTRGIAIIECSAGVARGAQVMATGSGAGKCSTASGATARSVGVVETATSNDTEKAAVRINLPNLNGPANS